jgi:nucleoid-associated protein YgaU
MSYSRYEDKFKFKNTQESYSEHFKTRDVKYIIQYTTPKFNYFDPNTIANIQTHTHIWKAGDRLYKLAYEYYNDASLWWVIAWFNKKPTESHYEIGQQVYIPKPLDQALAAMGI